ncbi:hypothetical protein MtrunA17_Chr7g0245951 [Medicago truncatula]|uniref:Uncharacterized protein n=1 Tax=Medicago truncatula TaxID=3880 RepID=G7L0A6_MEDTR|nr:hypothetical protein MTR_7g075120 [Medicago truncatula]RHN46786.1 hypothetical protein MtrunA17_Chr7g0245951 [Medicago truncatula]
MCCFSSQYDTLYAPLSKRHNCRHLRLSHLKRRKRMIEVKAQIKMKNLKLYMENQTIIEQNEKLRKQAMLLHKENQDLMSQLQMKLSEQNINTNNN